MDMPGNSGIGDKEIEVMAEISRILSKLEPDAAARVTRWAAERYGGMKEKIVQRDRPSVELQQDASGFQDFADLYHAVGPSTDAERVLAAGYWLQCIKNDRDFGSQKANTALKDLGYGVGSINKAFDDLINRRPSLAMQVGKSGSSQQARRRYRLTEAGVRKVQEMITGADHDKKEQ